MRPRTQEAQLAVEVALGLGPLLGVGRVPLVDGDHDRAAGLENVAGDMRILLGDAVRGIEQQHHDVRVLDRLQRLDDREFLDRLEAPCRAALMPAVSISV